MPDYAVPGSSDMDTESVAWQCRTPDSQYAYNICDYRGGCHASSFRENCQAVAVYFKASAGGNLHDEKKLHFMNNIGEVPPTILLTQARKEIARMGDIASSNLELAIDSFFNQDVKKGEEALQMEEVVDYLNYAIVDKLVELHTTDMSQKDMNLVHHMMLVVSHLERISDYAENVVEYGQRMRNENAFLSESGHQDLLELAQLCLKEVKLCIEIFVGERYSQLKTAEKIEERVDNKQLEIIDGHVKRLANAGCNPLAGVIFTDMANDLERCSDHAISVARALDMKIL